MNNRFPQINKLEETIQDLNDRLAEADLRQERVLKEKNAIIRMKDEEISELKAKMDDMAEEFGEMLRVRPTNLYFEYVNSQIKSFFDIGNFGENA